MENNFQKWIENVNKEVDDAFQTVGSLVRARMNILCNERKVDEAKELENAYNVINKHFGNKFAFKAGDKK